MRSDVIRDREILFFDQILGLSDGALEKRIRGACMSPSRPFLRFALRVSLSRWLTLWLRLCRAVNPMGGNGGIKALVGSFSARSSRLRDLPLLVFLAFLASGQIWRDKPSRKNAEGNALYQQKNYPGALEKYVEAQDGKSHQQELAYNLANSLYQQKKYPEALKEFERAIFTDNPSLNQKVHFNRGNAFFQMGKYEEAVESFKKTLELNPGDKDAKHNLELALKKLQENPQNQKKNSQKQDQKQNQEQQQGQNQSSPKDSKDKNPESQKQQSQPQQKSQNLDSNQPRQEQKGQLPKPQRKAGMDPKEALRILDALNQQEKQEQRKQALKIQRERTSGKDW
jgi:Ca-activated chloride channel family protein